MNAFNDDRHDETDELSVMINELPRVDPPSTLVGAVMSRIAPGSKTHVAHPPANFMRRGKPMAKKVLWSVAAAAAAVLVIMRLAGYPPVEKGTEATIGAAQRYQAPQIATADVKIEDAELQAFLQSDLFRTLAADRAAQQALKNQDFQKALANANVRAALAAPGVASALYRVRPDAAANARLDLAKLDAAPRAALQAALDASPALATALAAPGVAEAISHSALEVALARPDVSAALAHPAVMNALVLAAPGAALDAAATSVAPGAAAGAQAH